MDKYITERRARVRLSWFKRFGQIANVSQVCRECGIARRIFYKWWLPYIKEGLVGLRDFPRSHPDTVPEEISLS